MKMTMATNASLAARPASLILLAKVGLHSNARPAVGRPTLAKEVDVAFSSMIATPANVISSHDAVVTAGPNGRLANPLVDATSATPNAI